MPANITLTTSAGGPQGLLRNYWKGVLEDVLRNQLLAADLMDVEVIPANSGAFIEFHRINSFPKQMIGISQFFAYATLGALKGQSFVVDSVVYGLEPIGNDLRLTEQSIMCAEPNPIPDLTEEFLYNAKDTIDMRAINIMVSNIGNTQTSTGASCTYMGATVTVNTTWGDGSQTLTEATLDANIASHRIAAETFNTVYTNLRSRSARPRNGPYYDTLIDPLLAGDLRTDATFQDIALKGVQRGEDKFEQATIGYVFGCRVMEDENVCVPVAGTVNATDTIIRGVAVGKGYAKRVSYAKGYAVPKVYFIPPTQVDKNDPYGMVGILVWKSYAATGGVLNPLAGELIKCVTTRSKSTTQPDDATWNA